MLTTKRLVLKTEYDVIESIRCDICKVNIFSNKSGEDEVVAAMLTLIKTTANDIVKSGIIDADDVHEREMCELCEGCYRKVIEFMKGEGAKVPSSFFTEMSEDDEPIPEQ